MHIDVAPETERLVREEIRRGHVRSVDEIITAGVQALRERHSRSAGPAKSPSGREKAQAFVQWAKDHPHTPPLSDEAISRAGMNPDR